MASLLYDKLKAIMLTAGVNLTSDTIKVALLTSTYTPSASHNFYSDLTNEVSGTGYTAGGATLTSPTVTEDNTNHRGTFDAADVTWASSSITARYAAIYKSTGTGTTSPLLALIDFGADFTSVSADFTITWNASGIFYFS